MSEPLIWAGAPYEPQKAEWELSQLVGRQMLAVNYSYPVHYSNTAVFALEGFDAVPVAITISLSDGLAARFEWAMDGDVEGLFAETNADQLQSLGTAEERQVHPSDALMRRLRLPQAVTEVGVSWHEVSDRAVTALWSIRFVLANSESLTIALGEVGPDNHGLEYVPDSLVAVYDREIAQGYRPRAALTSAWGRAIDHI